MIASTRRIACVAFGMLLVAAANPAVARASTHHSTTLEDGTTIRYDAATNQYCMTRTVTGSNLPQRECHTQEEWAKLGLTISGK